MTQEATPVAAGAPEPTTSTLAPESTAPDPTKDPGSGKPRPHRTR
ncbi:MAG: hypothetical protein QOE76_911, partial [Frankiales bacterium]|nr:hypothetical protein [Frankiales bacterium]